jgi:NAD+ synthase
MTLNGPFTIQVLTAFIREELGKAGFSKAVLGLSGGLDSSVCAALAARALGPKNVLALLMPYGENFSADMEDAREAARAFRIRSLVVDIAPMVDAYFAALPAGRSGMLRSSDDSRSTGRSGMRPGRDDGGPAGRVRIGNKMARERMSILYDISAREKALVLGTSNKTELLIGYGTIHGDTACAFNPLGDLYKTQVRQLAAELGVPEEIRTKPPTAGLWAGQTDEGELGLTYAELDKILYALVDERESRADVIARGFKKKTVDMIIARIKASEFKRQMPPIAKISTRTIGHDFLYPYDWGK